MTGDNPLDRRKTQAAQGAPVDLEEYARSLNRKAFVIAQGKRYFVAKRTDDDGHVTHFLDCR